MPNITPLTKTLYNNSNGEPKNQETADTRYEAWDAEQMSGKTNEIIADVNNLTDGTSGINTGDETTSSIQSKRPLKTVGGESLEGSGNIVLPESAEWGNITGTLSNQSDLQTALDGKLDSTPIATDSVLGGVYFKDDSASSTLTISTSPIV